MLVVKYFLAKIRNKTRNMPDKVIHEYTPQLGDRIL